MAIDGQTTQLHLLDTAGEESLSCMIHQSIIAGNGFVLVYSVTERDTFQTMEQYFSQVIQIKETPRVGVIIVGNKCDQDSAREVSTEEGAKLAKRLGVPFLETSAKTRKDLTQAFSAVVREMKKYDESSSTPVPESPRTPGGSKKKEKVTIDPKTDEVIKTGAPLTKKNSSGCLAIFRRRSKSESAKSAPLNQKEKEIVVEHM